MSLSENIAKSVTSKVKVHGYDHLPKLTCVNLYVIVLKLFFKAGISNNLMTGPLGN